MQYTVSPTAINGKVQASASKSYMQRAIALAILAKGKSEIGNPTFCNDALAALDIARSFGCEVIVEKQKVYIDSSNISAPATMDCGESGLAIRMFTPVAGLFSTPVQLTGSGSLAKRPLDFMEATLSQLGVCFEANGEFLPLKVQGPMLGGEAYLDGSLSSQFLTGLLIALPLVKFDSVIHVSNLSSKPYIDMTMSIIRSFGAEVNHDNYKHFYIPGNQEYNGQYYAVEGDWSGAAALLVAGAIGGQVDVQMLDARSAQADVKVLEALRLAGAKVSTPFRRVMVQKLEKLNAFEIDLSDSPDLFPVLAALAANADGVSVLHGVHRLKHKESDRAEAIRLEFEKLGIEVSFREDSMLVKGGKINAGETRAHHDHRMVMALSLLALNANGPVVIDEAESINKSYPDFFQHLESISNKQA